MRVDAQPGAISVTNPPAEATRTLERVHVDLPPGGPARIQRQPATGQVFSDSELTRMAHDTAAIARQVLDATRSRRPTASRPHAITIDIELKRVAKGWPALADGRQLPARLIYKQVRPLSRPPLLPPWELGDIRVPDEILAWAEKLVVWQCIGGGLNLRAHILHIAGAAPLLLPSERRFVARVETAFSGPLLAGQGLPAKGQRLDHWQLPLPRLSANGGLDLNLAPGQHGVRLQIDGQGRWGLRRDGLAVAEGAARCVTVTKVASNSEWLRRLLDRPR